MFGVFSYGLVVGFNFGFGRTKTTRNVTWGSVLTPSRKNLKTAEKLKFGQSEVKSKMEFRAKNSKGVDKKNAKCNMGFDSDTFTKNKRVCVCVKASRAEGPRRLHTNTAYAHLWGFSRLSSQTSPAFGDVWLESRLKVQRWGFRVQGFGFRVQGSGLRFEDLWFMV